VFERMRGSKSIKNHALLAANLTQVLQHYETLDDGVQLTQRLRSRAGQCLAFHAGEQVHAGMGWDGESDPCFPKWAGRVVSYFFALPKAESHRWSHTLFNPESPWGLMREGITALMVVEKFCFTNFVFPFPM